MDEPLQQILIEALGNTPMSLLLFYLWFRCANERREAQQGRIDDLRRQGQLREDEDDI